MPDKINPLLEAMRQHVWAIMEDRLPEALRQIALIQAGRAPQAAEPTPAQGGVMVLPIKGTIAPKQAMTWGTGLDVFREQLRGAAANENVRAILLDVDSPGGMVDGVQETAELIRSVRTVKPVIAHADSLAASAAYYLASQAGEVVAGRDAVLGSIGTLIVHGDFSKAYEEFGIKVTIVRNPPRKAEGGPLEPLSEAAQARFQEIVDSYTAAFQADVAKGRGVPAATVRSDYGQGTVLMAREALAAGMIDRVDSMDATLARMLKGRRAVKARAEDNVLVMASEGEEPELEFMDPPEATQAEATPADARAERERARALELGA